MERRKFLTLVAAAPLAALAPLPKVLERRRYIGIVRLHRMIEVGEAIYGRVFSSGALAVDGSEPFIATFKRQLADAIDPN